MRVRNSLALLGFVACSGPAAPQVPQAPPAVAAAATEPAPAPAVPAAPTSPATPALSLADVGLEAASLDRSVDPCVDFYQFACGGWLAANPIPADRSSWGRITELQASTRAALQSILAQATGPLGDFYASCVDAAALDRAGLAPVQPVLAKLAGVKDARTWLAALAELHRIGIDVVFTAGADSDFKDPARHVVYLGAAALGLPDRDYYVDAKFAATVTAYRDHVGRLVGLADPARAATAGADVLAIETELAKLTKPAAERRDVVGIYNPTDARGLAKRTKSIDWKAYWKAVGLAPTKKLVLDNPAYFAALDGLRKRFKPAQWASYFTYHYLAAMRLALPAAFDREAFALEQVLGGATTQEPRDLRCVDQTARSLGDLLGQAYVARHFPPAARQTVTALFAGLAAVMHEELAKTPWLTEPTRATAQAKLAALTRMIGYPDAWRTYDVAVARADFAGNLTRATQAEIKRRHARAGKPVDRGEWLVNAFVIDAFMNVSTNTTKLPAGILQPPFFGANRSVAANLGALGLVMGHELTHAFDDQGAQFDLTGAQRAWWTPEDAKQFAARTTCVAEQYSTFEALPKQFINGKLTLGENVADLGGAKLAFRAYRKLRAAATPRLVADGFDEDQQFFLGLAQSWCTHERRPQLEQRLVRDPHSPPKFRVYGALRNLPEFAEAFKCAPGTPMNPAQTCAVW